MVFGPRLTRDGMIAVGALILFPVAVDAAEMTPSFEAPTRTDAPHVELVDWAFDRYDEAGLTLPDDTTVFFHDSTGPCEGNDGTVRPERGNEVYVCVAEDEPDHQQHVLLHELAHLWTHTELNESARRDFLEFRGADHWNESTDDWWNRGTEQASEVITWGLLDRDPGFQRINDRACETMQAGYAILTGLAPINAAVDC